jgi:uncharacterized protein
MIGQRRYEQVAEFPVERGYIWTTCSSVENGNPLFWDDDLARALTEGPIAPPTMLSVWFRPHHWAPGRRSEVLPLQVHFDLKEMLGLPEAVISDNTMIFYEPVRAGDLLRTRQMLRSVSDEKETKLGIGRFWVIEVEYENQRGELVGVESYTGFGYRRSSPSGLRNEEAPARGQRATPEQSGQPALSGEPHQSDQEDEQQEQVEQQEQAEQSQVTQRMDPALEEPLDPGVLLSDVAEGDFLPSLSYEVTATTIVLGALASRDWRPMHHDKDFAVNRNGTKDIFLNTPNQAAWFERCVTDWTGPRGRLGRMSFRMRGSVFPGDTMVLKAVVDEVGVDEVGCGWVGIDLTLSVDGEVKTSCEARVAVPVNETDNPWARHGERWKP